MFIIYFVSSFKKINVYRVKRPWSILYPKMCFCASSNNSTINFVYFFFHSLSLFHFSHGIYNLAGKAATPYDRWFVCILCFLFGFCSKLHFFSCSTFSLFYIWCLNDFVSQMLKRICDIYENVKYVTWHIHKRTEFHVFPSNAKLNQQEVAKH